MYPGLRSVDTERVQLYSSEYPRDIGLQYIGSRTLLHAGVSVIGSHWQSFCMEIVWELLEFSTRFVRATFVHDIRAVGSIGRQGFESIRLGIAHTNSAGDARARQQQLRDSVLSKC